PVAAHIRQRGTVMVEGSGTTRALQCPHHGWTYRLDGRLAAAPHMGDQLAGSEVCLPRFAVAVWAGWVLVNLSGTAPSGGPTLDRLDEVLAGEQLTDLVSVGTLEYPSPWNWKISVENFVESYHHQWVHPASLQPGYPGGQSFARHGDDEPWSAVDHVAVDEGNEPFLAAVVYPNLLFAAQRGDGLLWFELLPVDAESTQLRIHALLRSELVEAGPRLLEGLAVINEEDITVNQATAQGLAAPSATAGPVSPLEEACWHFRRWLVGALRD
ncbi:MAG: SRPBCC family protein, partial [Actinomycetota bacterium]